MDKKGMGLPRRGEKCGSKTTSDQLLTNQKRRICVTREGVGLGGVVVHWECDKIGREGRGLPCVGEAREQTTNRRLSTNQTAAPTKRMKGLGGGAARWGT